MQVNSGPLGDGFPYLKFAWTVELSLGNGGEAKGLTSSGPMIAKTCELPRFSIETQIVNAYNHKTIVQTKMNYEPITMTFYDQTNEVAECFIWSFVKGQFDPSDASKRDNFEPLTVKITMTNLSGQGDDKIYTLKNAFIVDAQHDTLDYSTSDPVLWTITLRYEDLDTQCFSGDTPGDGGAGIAALPKPPSKTSTVATPVTQPPKADAKKEDIPFDSVTQAEVEWGITADDNYGLGNTTAPPKKITPWPESNSNPANNVSFDNNAQDPEAQTFVQPYNASTGTASTKIQSPASAKQAADARAAYARTDPRRLDSANGINANYKEAYANAYAKEVARIPPNATPAQRGRLERSAAKYADAKAKVASPKYTAQVRTQNADGSFTDRYVPKSVNNNPTISASQANLEQNYVGKINRPMDF